MGKFGKPWPKEWRNSNKAFKKPKGNVRVRGARKVVGSDGTKFDSKLEQYLYDQLKLLNIPFEFQHKIILTSAYRDNTGKAVRAWTWTVDFYFPWCKIIMDAKGYPTEIALLKMKLVRYRMHSGELLYAGLLLAQNKAECRSQALHMKGAYQLYCEVAH